MTYHSDLPLSEERLAELERLDGVAVREVLPDLIGTIAALIAQSRRAIELEAENAELREVVRIYRETSEELVNGIVGLFAAPVPT